MRHEILIPATVTVLLAALLVFAADGTGGPRTEIELLWDDGSAEGGFNSVTGGVIAAAFHAPESALLLRAVRFYIMDDGIAHPVNPLDPTTESFTLWVWRDNGGEPGAHANDGQIAASGYAEEAWLDVELAEPLDLSNEAHFPDGRFYVGLEWENRENPTVGLDLDPPFSGETWWLDWTSYAAIDTADAMIRAVVCDSTEVPVELRSWGRVKAEYQ